MEGLLQGIPRVVIYLDNILITGKEHIQALHEVLTRLEKVGLRVKKEKCAFMVKSIKYLVYRIDTEGLHPLKEKVSAITEAPAPKNVAELKAYLGLFTYYSKFLPNMSTALGPLYQLLKKNVAWSWAKKEMEALLKPPRIYSHPHSC